MRDISLAHFNFRDLDAGRVGLVGVVVTVALLVGALRLGAFFSGGDLYIAEFSEAGGLKPGNEVVIAGIQVGRVGDIELDRDVVRVNFTVEGGVALPEQTGANIITVTALGRKALEIIPEGTGVLPAGSVIPLSRTTSPWDLATVLDQLVPTVEDIDVALVADAFDAISGTFEDTPPELAAAIDGLARFSKVISDRDNELRDLLAGANGVTGVLADRNRELVALIEDGSLLFTELIQRRSDLSALLHNVAAAATELHALVKENEAEIAPTLDDLNAVVDIIEANLDNLDSALIMLGPFVRGLGEALASGPYFSALIGNLVPTDLAASVLPGLLGDQLDDLLALMAAGEAPELTALLPPVEAIEKYRDLQVGPGDSFANRTAPLGDLLRLLGKPLK